MEARDDQHDDRLLYFFAEHRMLSRPQLFNFNRIKIASPLPPLLGIGREEKL